MLGLYGFVSPRRVRGCQFFQIERFLINILINILFGGLQSRAAILDEETFPQAACPADAQPISQSRKVLAQFSEFLLLYPVKRFDHLQD